MAMENPPLTDHLQIIFPAISCHSEGGTLQPDSGHRQPRRFIGFKGTWMILGTWDFSTNYEQN
jgi:hypothetical protein